MELSSTSGPDHVHSYRTKETLNGDLDDLLGRYLDLVHRYHLYHQSMAKDFASGYFSLAQANFSNHNKVRHGQDFYDDRMQALTTFYINSSTDQPFNDTELERTLQNTLTVTTDQPGRKSTETETEKSMIDADPTGSPTNEGSKHSTSDPLNWFGILVPPTLRASQTFFRHAVTETIPSLANLSNEMKRLEIEIRRTRKKINKTG
ncbi:MAG: hypothetical protein Q9169_002194 [Polycauliona sp. 2 TL-2023]